jgi:hypothetical protein
MSGRATVGTCCNCSGANKLLAHLHGDKGGPLTCMPCGIEWHAKYGRRRKLGRIVIKAIRAYLDAGGAWSDLDRLKLAAGGIVFSSGEADAIGVEIGDITTELLEAAVRLTHPDRHPKERQESAQQVTQELLALKPFTFPAPEKAPPPETRNSYKKVPSGTAENPLRITYPCELCADQVPYFYCNSCRAEWEKRRNKEREIDLAKQRKWRARRRERQLFRRAAAKCAVCGPEFKGKRKDARYCSAACRQRLHRDRVTDNQLAKAGKYDIRHAEAAA